jgi:hypothetical protein
MRRMAVVVLLAGLGALGGPGALAGCATSPVPDVTPSATSSAGGLITPVSVTRAGGLAGVRQTLSIAADGSWSFTDAKSGQSSTGQLSSAQLAALVRLLTDPTLIQALSNHSTPTGVCNDGFQYTLQFGSSDTFTFADCGTMEPPVRAVIQALTDDTPF